MRERSWLPHNWAVARATALLVIRARQGAGGVSEANMPAITALVAQLKRRDRTNVFVDGEFALGLSNTLAAELRVGQELTAEDIARLQARDAVEQAYYRTLNYLSYRPRSVDEITRYLIGKGMTQEVIDQVQARLRRAGLVDDVQFAEFWVQSRESFRPRGRWALGRELRAKGVAPEVVEAAVAEVDEENGAMRVARKALGHLAHLDRDTFYRRLLGRLQRRGYGYGVCRHVVDTLWDELHGADADPEQRARPDHE